MRVIVVGSCTVIGLVKTPIVVDTGSKLIVEMASVLRNSAEA